MTISSEEIKQWNSKLESKIMDRKSYRILSEPKKLAELMVAFANNITSTEEFGGRILIGIDNSGVIETFQAKQGHEEAIMNTARDNCVPIIEPEFEEVEVENQIIYVVTIPKMTTAPFRVKTKHGLAHKIRVGSEVIDPDEHQLDALYSYAKNYGKSNSNISSFADIDLETDSSFKKFILKYGRKYVEKRHHNIKKPLRKEIWILRIFGCGLLIPLFATLFYSWYVKENALGLISWIIGFTLLVIPAAFLFGITRIIIKTKCKKCDSNFGVEKIKSKLLDEKPMYQDSNYIGIRQIQRNTYKCIFCNFTETKDEKIDYKENKNN